RALHVVAQARERIDGAVPLVEQLDREPADGPRLTARGARSLQGLLPRLGVDDDGLRVRSIHRRNLDLPAHRVLLKGRGGNAARAAPSCDGLASRRKPVRGKILYSARSPSDGLKRAA